MIEAKKTNDTMKLRHIALILLSVLAVACPILFGHYRMHLPFWAFAPSLMGAIIAVLAIQFRLWSERRYDAEIKRRIKSAQSATPTIRLGH
jgi:hypothetical protein